MQEFQDSNGKIYAYEDDVTITTASDGTTTGTAPDGSTLSAVPTDLTPYTPPAPTAADKLKDAKAAQRAQINADAEAAASASISLTTAAGTTATFPMTASAQLKYLGAYTRYVVHGKALPSPFTFNDINGEPVAMTVADIDNFATPAFAQVDDAEAKAGSLISQINKATTQSAVAAITWS